MDTMTGLFKLPIGVQSFVEMRTGGNAYVDKTRYIATLLVMGKYYFLSRPRRFGKSLFVDTLDCAFSGRRELFSGLWLDGPESGWDWGRRSPVIRISFGGSDYPDMATLLEMITVRLDETASRYGVPVPWHSSPGLRLGAFIRALHDHFGEKVVVLVDEYDKPILDNLDNPPLAAAMRDKLRGLYSALKDADPWLRLVFLTGVSKFAKAGIFS